MMVVLCQVLPQYLLRHVRPRIIALKATHRGKGKLFLDGWQERDLYRI